MQLILCISALLLWVSCVEACKRHEDCIPESALCFKRKCVAAMEITGASSCKKDMQCKRFVFPAWRRLSVGCKRNRCFKLAGIGNSAKCARQNQCPGQSICIRRICVPAEPLTYSCTKDAECKGGERCIGETCFQPSPLLMDADGSEY